MVYSGLSSVVERSNVTLAGQDSGAPAIVFLHGFGTDQNTWRFIAPAFEDRYQVVLFDLVGAGRSDQTAYDRVRHGSLRGHADDLLDVLRELGLHDVVFVGHSVGALIGVLAAIQEPRRFGRLVLLVPSPRYVTDGAFSSAFSQEDVEEMLATMESNYHGWAGTLAASVLPGQPEFTMELTNSFLRTNPEVARHFARVTFLCDHRPDLPFLEAPALILQCARDVVVPLAVGNYLHEQLPNSQLRVIDTAGHYPQLTAPGAVLTAIHNFLLTVAI